MPHVEPIWRWTWSFGRTVLCPVDRRGRARQRPGGFRRRRRQKPVVNGVLAVESMSRPRGFQTPLDGSRRRRRSPTAVNETHVQAPVPVLDAHQDRPLAGPSRTGPSARARTIRRRRKLTVSGPLPPPGQSWVAGISKSRLILAGCLRRRGRGRAGEGFVGKASGCKRVSVLRNETSEATKLERVDMEI